MRYLIARCLPAGAWGPEEPDWSLACWAPPEDTDDSGPIVRARWLPLAEILPTLVFARIMCCTVKIYHWFY